MAQRLDLDHGLDHVFREMAKAIEKSAAELHRIRVILQTQFANHHIAYVRIKIMPKSIVVGATATAHVTATKPDGSPFLITAADTVMLTASVPADVTFGTPTFNPDGSVDIPVTGVNPDPGDAINATVDGVTSAAPDTLTITAPVPTTVTVTLV
jgi:hypothetical protein